MASIYISDEEITKNAQENQVTLQEGRLTEQEKQEIEEESSQPEAENVDQPATGPIFTTIPADYESAETVLASDDPNLYGDDEPVIINDVVGWTPAEISGSFDFKPPEDTVEEKEEETYYEPLKIDQKTLDAGIKAAKIATKDANDDVQEVPSGSLSGPRVDVMLKNVSCRPGKAPWHCAAVATWWKEAGLPNPPASSASNATGWMKWAKDTHRFTTTPVVGAIAIYGTTDANGNLVAHDLGVVTQILDGADVNNVLCAQVIDYTVDQVKSNTTAIIGFILPAPDAPKKLEHHKNPTTKKASIRSGSGTKSTKKSGNSASKKVSGHEGGGGNKKGGSCTTFKALTPAEEKSGILILDGTLVFLQSAGPWQTITYGPNKTYTDVRDSGCGLCSIGSVIRNLTGNTKIDPGQMAKDFAKYHVRGVGSAHSLIPDAAAAYGLKCQVIHYEKSYGKTGITSDQAAEFFTKLKGYIVAVGKGKAPFSGGGHFIFVRKYDPKDDVFYVGNSWYIGQCASSNQVPYTWDQLRKKGMTAAWGVWRAAKK